MRILSSIARERLVQAMTELGLVNIVDDTNPDGCPGVCGSDNLAGSFCVYHIGNAEWFVWGDGVGDSGDYPTLDYAIDELTALIETPEQTMERLEGKIERLAARVAELEAEKVSGDAELGRLVREVFAAHADALDVSIKWWPSLGRVWGVVFHDKSMCNTAYQARASLEDALRTAIASEKNAKLRKGAL